MWRFDIPKIKMNERRQDEHGDPNGPTRYYERLHLVTPPFEVDTTLVVKTQRERVTLACSIS
jgi:hypothetical protein